MLDAPNMRDNDNSKKQDKQSSPRQKGFDVAISTQKLTIERTRQQREQEAKYASEHGVPTAHDILGSADFSQSKVPVSTFIETAHDILKYLDLSQQTLQTTSPIGHLSSNGLGFSAQKIIGEEVPYISGLYQKHQLTDALRRRINEERTTKVEASQQEPRSIDRQLRGDAISDLGPDKTSESTLAEQYNFLLRSTRFQRLARIVNSEKKITLKISPDMHNDASYYSNIHTIYIPQKQPDGTAISVEEIRECIIWEMHNASAKDQFKRARENFPIAAKPDQNAPHKEKEIYIYKMAAFALAYEWIEWTNVIEHTQLCQAINADLNMGAGGPHVTDTYQYETRPDGPWYKFDSYLKDQIEREHTTLYDPHAADASWAGKHLLAIVKKHSPARFKIMQSQVEDWLTGKTEKIKSPSNTPFDSLSYANIKKAQQHARVKQVGTGQILGPREGIS